MLDSGEVALILGIVLTIERVIKNIQEHSKKCRSSCCKIIEIEEDLNSPKNSVIIDVPK